MVKTRRQFYRMSINFRTPPNSTMIIGISHTNFSIQRIILIGYRFGNSGDGENIAIHIAGVYDLTKDISRRLIIVLNSPPTGTAGIQVFLSLSRTARLPPAMDGGWMIVTG